MSTIINGRFDINASSFYFFSNVLFENIKTDGSSAGIYIFADGARFTVKYSRFRKCSSSKKYGPLVSWMSKEFNLNRCCFSENKCYIYPDLLIYDDHRSKGSTTVAYLNMSTFFNSQSDSLSDYISAKTLTCNDLNSTRVHGLDRFSTISFCWFQNGTDPSKLPVLKRISVMNIDSLYPAIELGSVFQNSITWSLYSFNINNVTSKNNLFGVHELVSYTFKSFVLKNIVSPSWFPSNLYTLILEDCLMLNVSKELTNAAITNGAYKGTSFFIPDVDSCIKDNFTTDIIRTPCNLIFMAFILNKNEKVD